MRSLAFIFLIAVLLGGPSQSALGETITGATEHVVKVAVSRTGTITINGSPVSMAELRNRFAAASRSGAVVWYYREDAQGDPPKEAMLVMQAIVEQKLPVSFSSTPDFSTVVLPDGTVRAR